MDRAHAHDARGSLLCLTRRTHQGKYLVVEGTHAYLERTAARHVKPPGFRGGIQLGLAEHECLCLTAFNHFARGFEHGSLNAAARHRTRYVAELVDRHEGALVARSRAVRGANHLGQRKPPPLAVPALHAFNGFLHRHSPLVLCSARVAQFNGCQVRLKGFRAPIPRPGYLMGYMAPRRLPL